MSQINNGALAQTLHGASFQADSYHMSLPKSANTKPSANSSYSIFTKKTFRFFVVLDPFSDDQPCLNKDQKSSFITLEQTATSGFCNHL